jgi:hypothetical protein
MHMLIHGPTTNASVKQIQNGGEVQPAFLGINGGNVCDPFVVGRCRLKLLVKQVGSRDCTRLTLRDMWASPGRFALQGLETHQPRHALAATPPIPHASTLRGRVGCHRSCGWPDAPVRSPRPVGDWPCALSHCTLPPRIVATTRYAQHLAHPLDGKYPLMFLHKGIFHAPLCEKIAMAFLRYLAPGPRLAVRVLSAGSPPVPRSRRSARFSLLPC